MSMLVSNLCLVHFPSQVHWYGNVGDQGALGMPPAIAYGSAKKLI